MHFFFGASFATSLVFPSAARFLGDPPRPVVGIFLAFSVLCAIVVMAFCFKDLLGEFIPANRVDYYFE